MKSDDNGRTQILSLRTKNVKCIRAATITPTGEITEIAGDAGQGKTGILDSIRGALIGLDPSMVRNGTDQAEILLELTSAKIKRIIRADASKRDLLAVKDAEGNNVARAQEFLRTICGDSAFNPIEWVRQGGGDRAGKTERLRQQRDMLLKALPLTIGGDVVADAVRDIGEEAWNAFDKLDILRFCGAERHALLVCHELLDACFDRRKMHNVSLKQAEANLANSPPPSLSPPDMTIDECRKRVQAANNEYFQAVAKREQRDSMAGRLDAMRQEISTSEKDLPARDLIIADGKAQRRIANDAEDRIKEIDKKISELQDEQSKLQSRVYDAENMMRTRKAELDKHDSLDARREELRKIEAEVCGADAVDVEAIKQKHDDACSLTRARQQQDEHQSARRTVVEMEDITGALDDLVALFRDTLPKQIVREMKMPVEGLTVDGDTIKINDVPLHQLGTSEQIAIGVRIAAALNPRCGFILIDGAESLGTDDRLALANTAKELGLQLILTVVDPDAEPDGDRVVMRNGRAMAGASS